MGQRHGEIDEFIYRFCYEGIYSAVSEELARRPLLLDLSRSRIKYPDAARLEDMLLEFTRNIRVDGDRLRFEAILSCTVHLTEASYDDEREEETTQWLVAKCVATVTDRLRRLKVSKVQSYKPGAKTDSSGQAASRNIVPLIRKADLDDEATAFLKRYCPEALEQPMSVPIEDIAKAMGLKIIMNSRITEDFSVLGEIYFTSAKAEVYDLFNLSKQAIDVRRGTILVDVNTSCKRNMGCVKNTIAHEVFHWHRHRLYASVKHLLDGESYIACRCPSDMAYPKGDAEWTDVERMEWQANSIAPRILMPAEPFKNKVHELYEAYDYANSPIKTAVLASVADDLARFFGVSRQSALIRMMETGFEEAKTIYDYDPASPYHGFVAPDEAFIEYLRDDDFRELIDSGRFRYADGHFVVNDERYLSKSQDGRLSLTAYAWLHLDECTLQFVYRDLSQADMQRHLPFELFHRSNPTRRASKFDPTRSSAAVKLSEEVLRKREEFERQNAAWRLTAINKTPWQLIYEIIVSRGISKAHFCALTCLGEEMYRRAEKNINTHPSLRTIIAIGCGLDLDIDTVETLMRLSGHAFDESDESRALRYCITGLSGRPIEVANEFLESYGYEPLGTKQRL